MATKDIFLVRLRNNNELSRHFAELKMSEKEQVELCEKYRHCKHLFVVIKKSQSINKPYPADCANHPDLVECVKCGFTNRLATLVLTPRSLSQRNYDCTTKEFINQFGWENEELDKEHFLSREELPSYHPGILYEIACEFHSVISKDTGEDNMEDSIFNIMKELHEEETSLERSKISSLIHASALIERYKKKH